MARSKPAPKTAPEPQAIAPAPSEKPQPEQPTTVLQGRLTRDPELRKTKSGKSVTTIRIAVNPENGDASFHSIVVWNRTAEVVCQFLKKGRRVEVEGRSQERTYQAQDGTDRTVTEVSAFRVQFLPNPKVAPAAAQELS